MAANHAGSFCRIGHEEVKPCEENSFQESSLDFYGTSFLTNETGEVIEQADKISENILYAEYDFDNLKKVRLEWGMFRDRRPEMYDLI